MVLTGANAQEVITISKTFTGSNRIEKTISVTKADTNIYHGQYSAYHPNGKLYQTGTYILGQRDSLWLSYFDNGNKETEGFYSQGKEAGTWKYYKYDGTFSGQFNLDSIKTLNITNNSNYSSLKLDLNYPEKARDLEVEGKVMAAVMLDSVCTITNFVILTDPGYGLGTEVMRVLQKNKAQLQKFILSGPCNVQPFFIPFIFRLSH